MKKIVFGDSSFGLRLDFPSSWKAAPTSVSIRITDPGGTELLATVAATIPPTNTLAQNAVSGAESLDLSNSVPIYSGDRFEIDGRDTPAETVTASASGARTMALASPLRYSHEAGLIVRALFATYSLDASSPTDYPAGRTVVVTWTPNTDEPALREEYEIVRAALALPGLEGEFQRIYPTEHQMTGGRFASYEAEARRRIESWFRLRGRDMSKLVGDDLNTPMMELMVWLINKSNGGDTRQTEASEALKAYEQAMAEIGESPIWIDTDGDGTKDDEEWRPSPPRPPSRGYC